MTTATELMRRTLETWDDNEPNDFNDCMEEIRAFLAAEPEAEPVAWIPEDELPERYPYNFMFQYSKVDIIRWFPIYGPPKPEPAIRKPMTEEELQNAANFIDPYLSARAAFKRGVRFAEKHHGIGGDDGNHK